MEYIKSFQKISILSSLVIIILFSSCQSQDENLHDNTEQSKIELLLNKMKEIGDTKGKIVKFNFENFNKENYLNLIEVSSHSREVFMFNNPKIDPIEDNYTVTCYWGDGTETVTECGNDVRCAGSATWDCLDNGGCARVCNARITYVPSNLK